MKSIYNGYMKWRYVVLFVLGLGNFWWIWRAFQNNKIKLEPKKNENITEQNKGLSTQITIDNQGIERKTMQI